MDFKQIWTLSEAPLDCDGDFLGSICGILSSTAQLGGKVVEQSDILQGKGMIKEVYRLPRKNWESIPSGRTRCLEGCQRIR